MTSLFSAINSSGRTQNGAATNLSSLSKVVDLFFLAGASRGKDISPEFIGALSENEDAAVRIMLWARDARQGAGERETFRKLLTVLIKHNLPLARRVIAKVPELGRWDDLLVALRTPAETDTVALIKAALGRQDRLAAKWMPRQGNDAALLRARLGYTPKQWRKLLVGLSDTVEQKMCAGEWTDINYQTVPSVASARYQAAFKRHDPDGYAVYTTQLTAGEATINAGAVYPYDIIRSLRNGDADVASAQWAALPDYLEGSTHSILPVVDVSASMNVLVTGSVSAMDVAISVGLYLSERTAGMFKDQFVTFSQTPEMISVKGSLKDRYMQMRQSNWGMNTNLSAVFALLLSAATRHAVREQEMPRTILILSDMEFDQAINGASAYDDIKTKYAEAGYELPNIVFWNICGRIGNVPALCKDSNVALVSGASPSVVKGVLSGKNIDPATVMFDTIMIDRYNY